MAEISAVILRAGSKTVIPLGNLERGDINLDFQISLRRLYASEPGYRGERDITDSPVLKIRPVHGKLSNVSNHPITSNSFSNKVKRLSGVMDGNSVPDIVPRDLDEIIEEEFQIPESIAFDMAAGINTVSVRGIYCSAVLIDDSDNGANTGDLVVTVVA